jgi:hypothetical protein
MSMMLTLGVCGLTFGQQATHSESSQSQTTMQQQDKDAGWEKIGTKTINLSEEKGIFNWSTDREKTISADEKYSAIRFKSKDATVNLTHVEVEYEDGKKEDLHVDSPLQANAAGKILNLENENKELDKITFNYQKDESAPQDRVQVEVWGLKSDAASGMGRSIDSELDRQKTDMDSELDRQKTDMDSELDRQRSDTSRIHRMPR